MAIALNLNPNVEGVCITLADVPDISPETKAAFNAIAPAPQEICSLKQRALNVINAQRQAYDASQNERRNIVIGTASFLFMSSLITGSAVAGHYFGHTNPATTAGIIIPLSTAHVSLSVKFIHMITNGRLNICNVLTSVFLGTFYPLVWGFGSKYGTAKILEKEREKFLTLWVETRQYIINNHAALTNNLHGESRYELANLAAHFAAPDLPATPVLSSHAIADASIEDIDSIT